MRSLHEARSIIEQKLARRSQAGQSGEIANVDFVLCEDFTTVMIYVDCADEEDALAVYFDLPSFAQFDAEECRAAFEGQSRVLN